MDGDRSEEWPSEFDLNVALGLEPAPANYDYSIFESAREREYVDESDSDDVGRGNESDCEILSQADVEDQKKEDKKDVVVDIGEKNVDQDVCNDIPLKEDVDINEKKGDENVCNDIPLKEPKMEESEKNEVKKDDKDVDKKKTEKCDSDGENRRTADVICSELEDKLKIGSEFPDLEIYLLCCEYARFKGFSVRKGEQRYFGKSTTIRWKEFICSCNGLPNYRHERYRVEVYKKLVMHTNCKSRLVVSRHNRGSFAVIFFEKEHNHILVECDQSFLLRSSRQLSYAKKSVMEALNSAGIGVTKAYNFMAKECGGAQNVGFTKKDAYHHMDRVRMQTKVKDGNARLLLDYFNKKTDEDPLFFYEYELDGDGRLMNIFFRDNRCAVDYDCFRDILSIDTTYRTNKYNMICAPFVGINHHTRNVMFGMAMLSSETTKTFIWLFETFLRSMHGKQPSVIFTDQCKAMMNAIDVVFPEAKHRLCQWHIMKNCATHFGSLYHDSKFKGLWYRCMNIVENEADFETTWREMVENYKIPDRKWFDSTHEIHHWLASCFSRGTFTAGLLATSRSELTNMILKQVVRCTIALSTFKDQYDRVLMTWRGTERAEDTFSIWDPGHAIRHSGLLRRAGSVFTRTIYKQFEHDYANCLTVNVYLKAGVILPNKNIQYKAKAPQFRSVERTVVFNPETKVITCDCGKWETGGLICRHILKVFAIEYVEDIPQSMIFRRWTKKAKSISNAAPQTAVQESATIKHMTFTNEFMRHMSKMVSNAIAHEDLRLKLVERMKALNDEFSTEIAKKFRGES